MSRCVTLSKNVLGAAEQALGGLSGAELVRLALTRRPSHARRVLAVGKAAWSMAAGASETLPGIEGLVVTKGMPPMELAAGWTLRRAGHPRPDGHSARATREALDFVAACPPGEELLVLLSGGTSSLLGGPIDEVTLEQMAALTEALLRSGRSIGDLNRVRRRLGAALGGRLGAATRASVRALVVSDVAGDDPRVIGSGPLSPPPADDDERAALIAAEVGASPALLVAIRDARPTPTELAQRLPAIDLEIIASPPALADAAEVALRAAGLSVKKSATLAHGPVEGLVAHLLEEAAALEPGHAYVIVGEPTVHIRGEGRGGRAQHTALALVEPLAALGDRVGLAMASDGTDGPTEAAGGIVSSDTLAHARDVGVDLHAALAAFDSHTALGQLGALVRTGPTGTNLTDLYVVARVP